MLPLETEGSLCPKPWIEESVLAKTAKRLGLRYHTREMLRLDAIFSLGAEWFPIIVAIEHENDYRGFVSEIIKLLSIRSPLKVGITYLYSREGREQTAIAHIEKLIAENFRNIAKIAPENERSEYLFLVGAENSSAPKQISRWYSLDFHACDDWQDKRFKLEANS